MPTTPYLPPPPTTQGSNLSPTDYQWMLILQGIAPLYEVDTSKGSYTEAAPSAGVSSSGQTAQCKEITYIKTSQDSNTFTLTGVLGGNLVLTKQYSTFKIKSDGTNWYADSSSESGSGPVLSFIGRTGNVFAERTDYSAFYDALGAAAAAQAAAEAASDPVGSAAAAQAAAEAASDPVGSAAAAAAAALAMAEAFSSNANNLSSGTVPNARLANIPNSALANDAITIDGDGTIFSATAPGAVALGASGSLVLKTQNANTVVAGPASGSAAAPTARLLVVADLPANPSTPTGAGFFGGSRIGTQNVLDATGQLLYQQNPGDLVAMLFYLDQEITITHLSVNVTAANGAATTFDAGLYTAAGALVLNTAGFNGNSATLQTLSVAQGSGSVTLAPGWYYLAWCTEGASTSTMRVSCINNDGSGGLNVLMSNARGTVFAYKAQAAGNSWNATGILPSTLPALANWTTTRPYLMAYFGA